MVKKNNGNWDIVNGHSTSHTGNPHKKQTDTNRCLTDTLNRYLTDV